MSLDLSFDIPDFDISSLIGLASSFFGGSGAIGAGVAGGAVMGKIGNFPFMMHQNEYKKVSKTITAEFAKYKPIEGQVLHGSSGGFTEAITVNGILVVQPINALDPLEWYVKMRSPLRYTTLDEDIDVVLTQAVFTKTHHSIHGRHRVQLYNLQMEGIYGGLL
jgi:hypothetical protein